MTSLRKFASICFLVTATALLAACSTTSGSGSDPEVRRNTIDTNVNAALDTLFREIDGSRQLVENARGVLVFPTVVEAGLVFGASSGTGALRVDGETVSYHRTTSGTWGLQAGAQSTAVFILFMTEEALTGFQNSSGWSAGADANVTVITAGANARVTTDTAQQPVIGFVLANGGLMAGATINGTRITRLDL